MLSPNLIEPFLNLLRKRAADLYLPDGARLEDNEDFADWLNHQCGWDYERSLAIANGEEDVFDWDEDEILLVCDSLSLESELVELLFQPISQEGLVYAIQEHYKALEEDNPLLLEMVYAIERAPTIEDAYELILAYIDEFVIEHDTMYELADEDDILMVKQLLPAFFALNRPAQHRVLELIHQELEEVADKINLLPVFLGLRALFNTSRRDFLDSMFSHGQPIPLSVEEMPVVKNYISALAEMGIGDLLTLDGDNLLLGTDYVPSWFDSFHE